MQPCTTRQDHYDFGMRAVKSVLVMAGSLKRANPDIDENVTLIRAMQDSNQPKFLADDVLLFQSIIGDLFPGVVIPQQDYGKLKVRERGRNAGADKLTRRNPSDATVARTEGCTRAPRINVVRSRAGF
jgi:hypothetical protein